MTQHHVTIGIVIHDSMKYLALCLESLSTQTYPNYSIVVFDNASRDGGGDFICQHYPDIHLTRSEKNLGYGAAHNHLLRDSRAPFYMVSNVDIVYAPDFLERLVAGISSDERIGSVQPKLYRWDFNGTKSKTRVIDSCGIRGSLRHCFESRGEGEEDIGQFADRTEIWGVDGAAGLYRKSALEEASFIDTDGRREFYDETIFLYREDVDLAYRLNWAAYRAYLIPDAVAWHDRTATKRGNIFRSRYRKSRRIRQLSLRNYFIFLIKNFSDHYSFHTKFLTFWRVFFMLSYALVFEPYLWAEIWNFWKLWPEVRQRKLAFPHQIRPREMERRLQLK